MYGALVVKPDHARCVFPRFRVSVLAKARCRRDSALVRWYRQRTAKARGATRKTMIVALARKLLIGLWRMAITGEVPEGVVLRSAA